MACSQMYNTGEAELWALLTVARSITPILYRVQAYEVAFTAESTKPSALEFLRSTSIDIYSTCFKLIAHTSKELNSKWQRTRQAILKPGKVSEMLGTLKSQAAEHDSAVNLCHITSTSESSKFVQSALQKLQQSMDESNLVLFRVEKGVNSLLAMEKGKLLDWISDVKYTDDHTFYQKQKTQNTCTWLLGHRIFEAWDNAEGPARFWLQGNVGTGKSVLSSSVIDRLLQFCKNSIEDGGFAFFYCNRQIPDRRESSSILRSYVRQLSATYRSQDEFRQELQTACLDAKSTSSHLGDEECLKQIVNSVNLYPWTVIVLDGLDECNEKHRKTLLEAVEDLFAQATKPLKIYIASRPTVDIEKQTNAVPYVEIKNIPNTFKYKDIKERFDEAQYMEIEARLNAVQPYSVDTQYNVEDIRTYVERAIDGHPNWNDQDIFLIPSATRELIVKTLTGERSMSGEKSPPMYGSPSFCTRAN